jgi:hypothetical protein
MRTTRRKDDREIPPLTDADLAAGIRMNGDKLSFPPPVVAPLHSEHRTCHCKNCRAHLRDCVCGKPEPFEIEDHGYKGPMTLPSEHFRLTSPPITP